MNMEELNRRIQAAKCKIRENNEKIPQLEQEYDDLTALRERLNSILEKHGEVCARSRAAVEDSVFTTNRSMQQFCSRFTDKLDKRRTTQIEGSIISAIEAIAERKNADQQKIDDLEKENQRLEYQIEVYRQELHKIVALAAAQGAQEE